MYTPHVHLSNINSVMFSCSPLFACNATPSIDVNQIIWRKFYYLDNLTDYITSRNVSSFSDYVLVHGRYRPPANITDSTLFTNMSLADKGQELRVVVNGGVERSGTEALGYYVPTVELNNQWTGIGPHTVVYSECIVLYIAYTVLYLSIVSYNMCIIYCIHHIILEYSEL